MKFHQQRFRHRPEQGEFGDCHRTVLACILDREPEEIPNFGVHHIDGAAFQAAETEWLRSQGLASFSCAINGGSTVEEALLVTKGANSGILCIFSGKSRNGCNHSVVADSGEIIHDPSIDQSGIIGPCHDGLYWIELIVPAQLVFQAAA